MVKESVPEAVKNLIKEIEEMLPEERWELLSILYDKYYNPRSEKDKTISPD